MNKTKIDWCDSIWNPVTGCLHGCEYCYARSIAYRFSGHGEDWSDEDIHILDKKIYGVEAERSEPYPYGFEPTFHRYRLDEYQNKKGRNIFVCSMADLFGDWVPNSWIGDVFEACRKAPQHNYLFLTKNPKRYRQIITDNYRNGREVKMNNFWFGTTITNTYDIAYNGNELSVDIEELSGLIEKFNTFISLEPLLGSLPTIAINWLMEFDWIIVGAETGRRKGKVIPERRWIQSIVEQCKMTGTPLFMKSSLADVWGEPLIQELPEGLRKGR